jgi:hypothetical protein
MTNGTRKGWEISVTLRPLFTSGKYPVHIVQGAGWAPEPIWIGAENLALTGIQSPDRPARSQSLYRLRYPARSSRSKDIQFHSMTDPVDKNKFILKYVQFPNVRLILRRSYKRCIQKIATRRQSGTLQPVKCVWIWQVGAGFCMQTEVVSLHFIRANGGCEYVQLDTSFKSVSDGSEWSVSHVGCSTSGQTAPTEREFVWAPRPSCTSSSGGKLLAPAGILSVKDNRRGGGYRGIGPLFFFFCYRWCERSNLLPIPLYTRERIRRTYYREDWVDSRVSANGTGEVKIPGLCRNSNPESSRP